MIDEIPIIGVAGSTVIGFRSIGALNDVKLGKAGSYITIKLAEKPRLRFK